MTTKTSMSTKADDFEDDDETQNTPTDSHVGSSGGEVLAELLIQSIAAVTTMAVLLSEADEDEWRTIYPRYATFLSIVEQLPREPRPRRRVGFRVRAKTTKKTTRRGKK